MADQVQNFPILVVDDEALSLKATETVLERAGYVVDTVRTGDEALDRVKRRKGYYGVVLVDYQLDRERGSDLARRLLDVWPEMYVLIYSGDPSREAVQLGWKSGAVGFVEKGAGSEILLKAVAEWNAKYARNFAPLCPAPNTQALEAIGMVGRSAVLASLAERVLRYRDQSEGVLILGETGTGKELIARALVPSGRNLLTINCAAYRGSTDLLESELFGYERGAFTGAVKEKQGVLEAAKGDTVFLDEVHHLSLTAQAKLLRVIQEKAIRRVGGVKEYPVKFRLISAAKPGLVDAVERGEFLPDLYHRLNVLTLTLAPLRERPEDIGPLVDHFCRIHSERTGSLKAFRLQTLRAFEAYPWPGNVRELENTVYRLLIDCTEPSVGPEWLDDRFQGAASLNEELTYKGLRKQLERQERAYILKTLSRSPSKSAAAKRLDISPTTLHGIMQRLGLYVPGDAGNRDA